MDIGADLRKARIAQQRSIDDVSRSTKISSAVLRAIENDDFAKVPGGLFARGFLRAYARDVGLDAEEIVRRYRSEFEVPETAPDTRATQPPAWPSLSKLTGPEDEVVRTRRSQIVEFGAILIVVAACFAFVRQSQRPQSAPAQAEVPAAAAAPSTAERPVATTGPNAAAAVGAELKVELHPKGPCWVEATADGERVVAKLMNAGDRQAITVREDLTLRIGDPTAFAFSIDGVPGRPFGRTSQPETIRINRQNYATFLEPRR
jgi:cytoskeleton protein RodZ